MVNKEVEATVYWLFAVDCGLNARAQQWPTVAWLHIELLQLSDPTSSPSSSLPSFTGTEDVVSS